MHFYADADRGVEAVNARVKEADQIIQPLKDQGLLTAAPFDEPIDFTYFENWHHWGRTAKFGMWMQGADYTQWHGAYEMLSDLADLRKITKEKLQLDVQPHQQPQRQPVRSRMMYYLAKILPGVRRLRIPLSRDQVMLLMVAFNEYMLAVEIYLAHSISGTIVPYEWIPIIFGPIAGTILILAGLVALRNRPLAMWLAIPTFLSSIVVGLLGAYFHISRAVLALRSGWSADQHQPDDLGPTDTGSVDLCPGRCAGTERHLGRTAGGQRHAGLLRRAAYATALQQDAWLLLLGQHGHAGDPDQQRARSCPHKFQQSLVVGSYRRRDFGRGGFIGDRYN